MQNSAPKTPNRRDQHVTSAMRTNAQMILSKDNDVQGLNNKSQARRDYNELMHQEKGNRKNFMEEFFSPSPPKQRIQIPSNWESQPVNHTHLYKNSPIARHTMQSKSFQKEVFKSRTINRKLRMRDTFTSIFGGYDHKNESVIKGKVTASH